MELLVEIEDDLIDFTLGLDQFNERSFRAIADFEGEPVGFAVELGPEWEEQKFDDDEASVRWGSVTLVSLGPASDKLLRLLDEAYETETEPSQSAKRVEVTAAALEGDPLKPQATPVMMKLFFNEDEEDEEYYAELYLNFDIGKSIVELREKDPEYRAAIVRALSAS